MQLITLTLAGIGVGALACRLIITLVGSHSGPDQQNDGDRWWDGSFPITALC